MTACVPGCRRPFHETFQCSACGLALCVCRVAAEADEFAGLCDGCWAASNALTDEYCLFVMHDTANHNSIVRGLAREVLRLRALEAAVRQLVECSDLEGGGQKISSYVWISPGDLAQILNRADRARGGVVKP